MFLAQALLLDVCPRVIGDACFPLVFVGLDFLTDSLQILFFFCFGVGFVRFCRQDLSGGFLAGGEYDGPVLWLFLMDALYIVCIQHLFVGSCWVGFLGSCERVCYPVDE